MLKYFKTIPFSDYIHFTLLLLFSFFAFFHHLDVDALFSWDESVYASNAVEMSLNGDWLVKYRQGKPEMWGTNPPLVCWLQTICIHVFGINELAVRLPSALAALGIILLIVRLAKTENLSWTFVWIASLILCTSTGYNGFHVTRTGDLDSVLIFFITGSVIYFFKFLKYVEKRDKYILVLGCFILLGYLSKGIVEFIVLPAFVIIAFLNGQFRSIIRYKRLYIVMISVLAIIVSYYLLREWKNPGYIRQFLNNEILQRFGVVNEGHSGPFYFYFQNLMNKGFFYYWLFSLSCIAIFIAFFKFLPNQLLAMTVLISALFFLLIISISETKLVWYSAPVIPLIAIFTGLIISSGLEKINAGKSLSNWQTLVLLLPFIYPVTSMLENNQEHQTLSETYLIKDKMEEFCSKAKYKDQTITLLTTEFSAVYNFYKIKFFQEYKRNFELQDINYSIDIVPGKYYLYTHYPVYVKLESEFNYEVLETGSYIRLVKILSRK